jgi:CheY-like chemotaxis protein
MSELPTSVQRAERPTEHAACSAAYVLIAVADERVRGVREQQLVGAGLRVLVARTGFEVIVKASCHIPDLILLDASLDAAEAAETRRLLATCPVTSHIPVLRLAPNRNVPRRVLSTLRSAAS